MAGPPMMPPGGGGQNGGDIANQLMELVGPILASPKGQQMAQAIMAQMGGGGGGDPMAMMAKLGMGGGGNPAAGGQVPQQVQNAQMAPMTGQGTDGDIAEGMGMLDQVSGGRPRPPSRSPDYATDEDQIMDDPRQTPMPSTEDEMAMVQGQINGAPPGGGGGGGMNSDGPTPQEVEMLKSSPTPRNMQNFDKLFGPGAAQTALGGGGGQPAPPSGGSTYEDDVKGAMDDAEDPGDHEYR